MLSATYLTLSLGPGVMLLVNYTSLWSYLFWGDSRPRLHCHHKSNSDSFRKIFALSLHTFPVPFFFRNVIF